MIVKSAYKKASILSHFIEAFLKDPRSKEYVVFCERLIPVYTEINSVHVRKYQQERDKVMIGYATTDNTGSVLYSPQGSKYPYMFSPEKMRDMIDALENHFRVYENNVVDIEVKEVFKEEDSKLIPDFFGAQEIELLKDIVICPCMIGENGLIIKYEKPEKV